MSDQRWQRIEEVFQHAADLTPADRRTFLDAACAGDDQLRREVESLLAHDDSHNDVLAAAISEAAGELPDGSARAGHDLAGQQAGSYLLIEWLGEGGMGVVYKARDTRLGRDVALKILPESFSNDTAYKRFQMEARAASALNHPNICAIYDVGEWNGHPFLVMELVDGESPKGPLPFDDAWKVALQIADALEYAHEKGVIHRDLKPANVKVTPDGVVKLLDFGLAKAFSETPDADSADPENWPTVTLSATVAGTVLGTAAYMSPEQAKGKKVDKRADIWSWGVVLYELLVGERLFKGGDIADTVAQVLTKEPPLERAPEKVRGLLGECLQKDPKQRLRDIGDARRLLARERLPSPSLVSRLGIVAAAAMTLIAISLSLGWWRATRPVERPLVQFDVDLGPDISLPAPGPRGGDVIISPDGARLAYRASVSGSQPRLFTRRLDEPRAFEIPGRSSIANFTELLFVPASLNVANCSSDLPNAVA
jgi:serine/threonine protein kinase